MVTLAAYCKAGASRGGPGAGRSADEDGHAPSAKSPLGRPSRRFRRRGRPPAHPPLAGQAGPGLPRCRGRRLAWPAASMAPRGKGCCPAFLQASDGGGPGAGRGSPPRRSQSRLVGDPPQRRLVVEAKRRPTPPRIFSRITWWLRRPTAPGPLARPIGAPWRGDGWWSGPMPTSPARPTPGMWHAWPWRPARQASGWSRCPRASRQGGTWPTSPRPAGPRSACGACCPRPLSRWKPRRRPRAAPAMRPHGPRRFPSSATTRRPCRWRACQGGPGISSCRRRTSPGGPLPGHGKRPGGGGDGLRPQAGYRGEAGLRRAIKSLHFGASPPAERKTATQAAALAPLYAWEAVQAEAMRDTIVAAASRRKSQEAVIAGLRSRLGKAKPRPANPS